MTPLTHFDDQGSSRMVDVSAKQETSREATAVAIVQMKPETMRLIANREIAKGDVFEVARLAGIMAAKQTSQLIPLCHPLPITGVRIEIEPVSETELQIEATVKIHSRTGVEMEALTAVSVASLTVYDMCKAVDREMSIGPIQLIHKSGGRSGEFRKPLRRPSEPASGSTLPDLPAPDESNQR